MLAGQAASPTADNWRFLLHRAARGLPFGTCRFTPAVADAPLVAGTGTSGTVSRYMTFATTY
jgi:hypothetical protein